MQVGDQLDRGNQEIEILYFLERLEREAAAAGGALHVLNGELHRIVHACKLHAARMAAMPPLAVGTAFICDLGSPAADVLNQVTAHIVRFC